MFIWLDALRKETLRKQGIDVEYFVYFIIWSIVGIFSIIMLFSHHDDIKINDILVVIIAGVSVGPIGLIMWMFVSLGDMFDNKVLMKKRKR